MPCKKGTRQDIEAARDVARRCDEEQRRFAPFDAYWTQLVQRVYERHEVLSGKEELFYRWSCIYGETMVDGIEDYFERRFDQFDADMAALRVAGFPDVATEFERARRLIFGDHPLDATFVEATIGKLADESEEVQPTLAQIDVIYRRLIPRLESLAEYKYKFGLRENLYSEGPEPRDGRANWKWFDDERERLPPG
jgi:hypothetical protein